ncbi:MAG TPA: hypothetical protein VHF01_13515 [Candidatus Acidoferrum sp.]|nr:hypothetical protein [Candidatus Acidoferrum sp.]
MRKAIAIAFALFGFATQAFAGCSYTADCPIDGETSLKVRCEYNVKDSSESCLYEHYVKGGSGGEKHRFWVTGCK